MAIKLDVVTAEKVVYSDNVDVIVISGEAGVFAVLPHHAPLMTTLKPGELLIKKGREEVSLVIGGGFVEVRPDHVIVLADVAERTDEIDITRAEEAKKRAQDALSHVGSTDEAALAEAALRRALARIEVAERRKKRKGQV
jgi:F-type H+-transporting ATPase subunit epsilon